MAFEDVNILVRVGTTTPVVRWRQDGAAGSLVTFSLSDNRDVRTYDWQLIGRPEGTGAAGGGPEPISLGTSQSCAITLDIQGTYIVACVINGGSPTQTIKTAGVAIICEITDPVGRPLRYLGGYETDEDLADPLVAQGWMKMLDRWLHALENFIRGGGADTFKVALDTADVLAATYGFLPDKLTSPNASIDIDPRVESALPKVGLDLARDARAPLGSVAGGNPGNGPKGAMWDHQHPPEIPAPDANGSWLYTARVPDTKLRDPVRCLLAANFRPLLLQPVKCLVADQGTWSSIYNPVARTLVRSTVGEIFGLDTSHGNTLSLDVGDRVWFRGEYTQWSQTWSGLYTVTVKGSSTEQAVLTATPFDAFSVGKCFYVNGAGAYGAGLWTCVQVSPVLSFSLGEPLPAQVDGCGFGTWWEQISGTNLWQAPVAGPIYGQDQFAASSILLATSNRCLAYNSDHIVDEGQYYGPYEVLDPGYYYPPGAPPVLTRAIIRRVLDADSASELCNGMTVRVTPGAVAYSGNYFAISTADPIVVDSTVLAWSISGSYTDGGVDRLLTTSQLSLASAETAEVATEVPAYQTMEMLVPLRPVTMDGTPGVSEFPAGPVTYEIACRVSSDDPTAEVLISVALSPSNVGTVWIAEATSQPIRATATTVYRLRAQVPAAVPLSLSDVLYWWFWVSNSGSSPVTLTIVYNDVAHSTRVQTTLSLVGVGNDDHQVLTPTSRGFVTGQEAAASRSRHPQRSIESFSAIPAAFASGNLTPASTADVTVISSDITIDRIDAAQWPGGCAFHTLFFTAGGTLRQGQGDSGDFKALDFGDFEDIEDPETIALAFHQNGIAELRLIGGAWHLCWYRTGRTT